MSGKLPLAQIRLDEGIQPRAELSKEVIEEYTLAMTGGAVFPPVTVFFDGETYWLADGFHRCHGTMAAGLEEIAAEIREGGRRDAILHAIGANTTHGLRRTNEDKRRAVQMLLDDPEWSRWSDREIARRCAVDGKTVAALRPTPRSADTAELPQSRTFVHPKTGEPTRMSTGAIGKRADLELTHETLEEASEAQIEEERVESEPEGEEDFNWTTDTLTRINEVINLTKWGAKNTAEEIDQSHRAVIAKKAEKAHRWLRTLASELRKLENQDRLRRAR